MDKIEGKIKKLQQDKDELQEKIKNEKKIAAEMENKKAKIEKRLAELDKELAEPKLALERAQVAVQRVKRKEMDELRGLRQPPEAARCTLVAVCLMLGNNKKDWCVALSPV